MKLVLLAAITAACSSDRRGQGRATAAPSPGAVPAGARQLVLGVTGGWDDLRATVTRHERDAGGRWRQVGASWRAVVGARGAAWGQGLHGDGPPPGRSGPRKQEGDGRSPAGVFALGRSFGYAPRPPAGARVVYTPVDGDWLCIDDPRSSHYTRVLDGGDVVADWTSAEKMRRADDLYRWVVAIDHNRDARPGGGSCIFLHIWADPRLGTAGCTALDGGAIEELLIWLDPAAQPVYALLPETELAALRRPWGLP